MAGEPPILQVSQSQVLDLHNQRLEQQIMMPKEAEDPSASMWAGKKGGDNPLEMGDINLRFSEPAARTQTLIQEQQQQQVSENKCTLHIQDFILYCLKCQEKICTKCLDTNHLLHPVVPLNSVNKLDFKTSLQKEIEKSREDIRLRESTVQNKIGRDLKKHKIALRDDIIKIRDRLREDFDDFFNNMLGCIRSDWNLFDMHEQLSKETSKFSKEILEKLGQITQQDEFDQIYYHNDLKKFYENLSGAQSKVQVY